MILTCERCGKPTDNIHNAMTKCMQCDLRLCDSCAQWTLIDAKWTTCDVCGDVKVCKQCAELVNRETFDTGAVRDSTDYRYDLMSPMAADLLLADAIHMTTPRQELALYLLGKNEHSLAAISEYLADVVGTNRPALAHLYAQALHEGARKYGERNWEKGLPKSNLINHALHHLFKLVEGDTSENHASHLVWNVLTLIHFQMEGKR